LQEADIVLGVVPSAYTRAVCTQALPFLRPEAAIVSATKGLEPATHLRMSEVIEQVFSLRFRPRLAVLSGPSFASRPPGASPRRLSLLRTIAGLPPFSRKNLPGQRFACIRMTMFWVSSLPAR